MVDYDAYIQPSSQIGKSATVEAHRRRSARRQDLATDLVGALMEIVYRALFVFGFLWLITRVTGRATLGELSTFQLLVYVTMGDLVQQAVTQQDYSVTSAVLAVGTFALITILLSWINSRSRRLRPITHGTPVVIIHGGEPLLPTMRTERISMDDLMAAARNGGHRTVRPDPARRARDQRPDLVLHRRGPFRRHGSADGGLTNATGLTEKERLFASDLSSST